VSACPGLKPSRELLFRIGSVLLFVALAALCTASCYFPDAILMIPFEWKQERSQQELARKLAQCEELHKQEISQSKCSTSEPSSCTANPSPCDALLSGQPVTGHTVTNSPSPSVEPDRTIP
jgi:hypothetical protein